MTIEKIDNLNWVVYHNNNPIGTIDLDPTYSDYCAMKNDYKIYGVEKSLNDAAETLMCGFK